MERIFAFDEGMRSFKELRTFRIAGNAFHVGDIAFEECCVCKILLRPERGKVLNNFWKYLNYIRVYVYQAMLRIWMYIYIKGLALT